MTFALPAYNVVMDSDKLPSGAHRQVVSIVAADNAGIDAFARHRVSTPQLILDMKRVGSSPDLFGTNLVSGSGSAVYSPNRASTALTVGTAVGKAIRQSKSRAVYQPGKSLLVFQTFICATPQANLKQSVGYFDTNNGIFLKIDGTTVNITRRSYVTGSPVDVDVPRSQWNIDPMDGTGPSGITMDCSKPQILVMDFEWLGVGRVRVGFVVDGLPVYCHQFLNANAALTSVYMSNPNLPVRWEIEATDTITGTATLEAICCSVNSEGGYEITGVTASTDSGTTAENISAGAHEEILAIRMQSGFTEFCTAFIQALSVINTTSGPFRWRLVLNPTETTAGTWTAIPDTIMERNIGRVVTVDTGVVITSGFVSSQNNQINLDARPVLTMGTTLAGVTDVISLQVLNLSVQAEDFYGSLTWREIA